MKGKLKGEEAMASRTNRVMFQNAIITMRHEIAAKQKEK